ncbi:hypothetical protein ACFL1V_01265 [Pseudomonadota bacterium]
MLVFVVVKIPHCFHDASHARYMELAEDERKKARALGRIPRAMYMRKLK